MPAGRFRDTETVLLGASSRSFWLKGSAWQFPDHENAETFVDRLVRNGVLLRDPIVEAALAGRPHGVSPRTVRHRFLRSTGLTQSRIRQIERAQRADVTVIGVEPAGAPKMSTSLAAGHPVTLEKTGSIADGLLPLRPGDLTFAHVKTYVDRVITVTDDQIAAAVNWLFRTARIVAEPSGAVTTAAYFAHGAPSGKTVAIVSGGNVAPEDFARYTGGRS